LQFLDEIHDDLEVRKVKTVIARGELHRFNDFLQRSFGELSRLIGEGFFGHPPAPAGERPAVASPARRSGAWEPGQAGPVERGPNEPSRTPARMTSLEVRHTTVYRYAQPVTLGPHRAMIRPRGSHDLKLRSATLAVTPAATVRWVHDVFGNSITLLDFTEPATELRLESRITLEHYPLEQPDYPIAARAERWPFAYSADERVDLGPTLARYHPDDGDRVRGWAMDLLGGREMGTMELLIALTKGIKESLRYAAREEEGTQEPLETIERGGGSCRDYALLMMEAVRSLGFAARFVTGYLHDPALDGGAVGMQGAGATHAWAQVYLPGAGWIEFDPTNGIIGGKHLIRVGVTRDPKQAVPVAGTFTGPPGAFAGLEVDVQVTCVDPDRVS
jgi:transglutaminase-like putative cysteine protease